MDETLQKVLNAINSNTMDAVDIVQKIDTFYNNAWNKLIFLITVGFTIVGVIVPLFIQWLQKRSLKASEELLKKEIEARTLKIKKEITDDLLKSIDEKFKEYENEIKITRASGKAKTSLAEAKYNLEKNNYPRALGDFITSAYACIASSEHRTLQDIIKYILGDCLPYLSQEEIEDLKIAKSCDLNLFLDFLTKKDDRGIFHTSIGEIRVLMTKLPKSKSDKKSEQSKKV
jgi:hypothetical protein